MLGTLGAAVVSVSVLSSTLVAWDAAAAHDRASRDAFVGGHLTKTAPPPFAFVYGGKASSGLIGKWSVTSEETNGGREAHPDGRLLRPIDRPPRHGRLYDLPGFPGRRMGRAVQEHGPGRHADHREGPGLRRFLPGLSPRPHRSGHALSGPGQQRRALRLRARSTKRSRRRPRSASGRRPGAPPTRTPCRSSTSRRRSAASSPPIGWSGRWEAVVGRKGADPRSLDLTAGMAATHFKLHPGEEVRTPSIALLFWKSADRMAGHNLFRRFVLAHHTPQAEGKPAPLPINHGVGFGGPFPCNEYVCATESYAIGMIERLHQFGIEPDACWIDAGWYENATRNWWSGVGTWTVNKTNFPRGLKPVTEAAKKWGQGFVVWFEPERVYEGTWLDREHTDWLTVPPRESEPPARPGQPGGAGLAHRPHLELHQGRGRDDLPAGLQLRPGALLEGHGRAGPRRHRRDEAHRGALRVLGRAPRAQPRAPHRQLRLGRTADRPRDDEPQHPALADRLPVLRAERLPVPHLRPPFLPAGERHGQRRPAEILVPELHGRRRGHGLGAHRDLQPPGGARGHGRVPEPAGLSLRRLLSADGILDGRRRLGGLPVGPAGGARRDRPGLPAADGAAGGDRGQARRARARARITR